MNTQVTQQDIQAFRARHPSHADAKHYGIKLTEYDITQMILCNRQRDAEIKQGRPYYDYDKQCWVGKRGVL